MSHWFLSFSTKEKDFFAELFGINKLQNTLKRSDETLHDRTSRYQFVQPDLVIQVASEDVRHSLIRQDLSATEEGGKIWFAPQAAWTDFQTCDHQVSPCEWWFSLHYGGEIKPRKAFLLFSVMIFLLIHEHHLKSYEIQTKLQEHSYLEQAPNTALRMAIIFVIQLLSQWSSRSYWYRISQRYRNQK